MDGSVPAPRPSGKGGARRRRGSWKRSRPAPLRPIASGGPLPAAPPEEAGAIVAGLRAAGIAATVIGRLTPPEEGFTLRRGGRDEPLPEFAADEVARLFG